MILSVAHLAVLLIAAFFASALNAAAGGGMFLTLPALMFAGLPPVVANATGSVALLPGYVASTFGFREGLHHARPAGFAGSVVVAIAGGYVGARAARHIPARVLRWGIVAVGVITTVYFLSAVECSVDSRLPEQLACTRSGVAPSRTQDVTLDSAMNDSDPRPTPPEKPLPCDCCDTGCDPCVYDVYADELEEYDKKLAEWKARHPEATA